MITFQTITGFTGIRQPPAAIRSQRRGMALYVVVLSTALIVSLLGLAGLTVVRIERRQAQATTDLICARMNARSAVEWALAKLSVDTAWRGSYANGAESISRSMGPYSIGSFSFILEDADGSLAVHDTLLRLKGVGRVGDTVQVASVEVNLDVEAVLRSQTDFTPWTGDKLKSSRWWCQYFRPNLPAGAVTWKVTSVEILCARDKKNQIFQVQLLQPLATNMPSTTVVDSVTVDSAALSTSMAWRSFDFSADYALDSDDGLCLALTTTADSPLYILYNWGGIWQSNTALIRGYPSWSSYEVDEALFYRVHGIYSLEYGDVKPVKGTWLWEAAP